jgi:8-oxo-dGTP pyrophosphatase MutT (NUDIX family)
LIALATGLLVRDERVLLVASRYPNHPQPLWNLPGGRQLADELLAETAEREFLEETGLRVRVEELAYVSESYDGATHFVNATFTVLPVSRFDETCPERSRRARYDIGSDHVVKVEWVPIAELERRIAVRVVREPLLSYLRGELNPRYVGFHQAGVTIEWPPDSG